MVTQTIKHWLNRLFAWWPWKRSLKTDYTQSVTNMNPGPAQDLGWQTTPIDGPMPQPGMMSVAVEQDKGLSDTRWLPVEEHPVSPPSPGVVENSEDTDAPITSPKAEECLVPPSPTFEQQLAFLQYLMKRGIINEGFHDGQVPRQYTRKYE